MIIELLYRYLLSVLESVQIHPGHTHWVWTADWARKNTQILQSSVGKVQNCTIYVS